MDGVVVPQLVPPTEDVETLPVLLSVITTPFIVCGGTTLPEQVIRVLVGVCVGVFVLVGVRLFSPFLSACVSFPF